MAVYLEGHVVIAMPAELSVAQVLREDTYLSAPDILDFLSGVSKESVSGEELLLAKYLTAKINEDYQNPKVVEKCYEVALSVFKKLSKEKADEVGFHVENDEVSIFSENIIEEAVGLDKDILLKFFLSSQKLNLENIQKPLLDFILRHSFEDNHSVLQALGSNQQFLLQEFVIQSLSEIKSNLQRDQIPYQQDIDDFLTLVKIHYLDSFMGISLVSEEILKEVLFSSLPKVLASLTDKFHVKGVELEGLKDIAQFKKFEDEMRGLLDNLRLANDVVSKYEGFDQSFHLHGEEVKTHIGCARALLEAVSDKISELPVLDRKRKYSGEAEYFEKARKLQSGKKKHLLEPPEDDLQKNKISVTRVYKEKPSSCVIL